MPSNSEIVRGRIELTNGPRIAASKAMWEHPGLHNMVPHILVRGWMVASASVPLMEFGVAQCESRVDDPVCAAFASYLRKHIPEELGHDEECLEDLEVLGIPREDVLGQLPYFSIVALQGMQYYWMRHRHPIAFAGYLAIIEGSPPSAERISRLQEATGLPADAFRTLLWHADHDGDHTREFDQLLDSLPLTEKQISLIGVNIARTNSLLADSTREMIAAFDASDAGQSAVAAASGH